MSSITLKLVLIPFLCVLFLSSASAQEEEIYIYDKEAKIATYNISEQLDDDIIVAGKFFIDRPNQRGIARIDTLGNVLWYAVESVPSTLSGINYFRELIVNDGFIYAVVVVNGSNDGQIWKVNATTGEVLWINNLDAYNTSLRNLRDFNDSTLVVTYQPEEEINDFLKRQHFAFVDKNTGTILSTHYYGTSDSGYCYFNIDSESNFYFSVEDT